MHDQIRRYATELAAPRASTRPRATSHGRVSHTDRRRPRRWLLLAALAIAIAASVFALLKPAIVNTGSGAARLVLSTAQVKIGDSYFISASGFAPGEPVRFSWTGPSDGVMGIFSTDSDGNKAPDPVFERHPPGNYTVTVTGLTSGHTASAELKVVQPGS